MYFRLFYQGQEHYFLTVLGTLGFLSTTTEPPSPPAILNHRSCKWISKNHAKSHLQQASYTIRHKEWEWFLLVQPMLPHPSPLKISYSIFFLKAYFVTECSVRVSEDPWSETNFQIQEAFPKLLCNNFNTDWVSMFIVLQQNAPI